jgi:hypothetical protein
MSKFFLSLFILSSIIFIICFLFILMEPDIDINGYNIFEFFLGSFYSSIISLFIWNDFKTRGK